MQHHGTLPNSSRHSASSQAVLSDLNPDGVQVQFYAPAAAGGGVSLVMAYLNGNDVPDLLRGRTLIVKWLGTMCGVTAGLAVGPEAPMVHMGACVASLLAFLDFGGHIDLCSF